MSTAARPPFTREDFTREILNIVKGMTAEFDFGYSGEIGPDTRLGEDLDFESVHLVELFVKVEKHFLLRNVPFRNLFMKKGEPTVDLTLGELAEFLHRHCISYSHPD